MDIKVFLYEEYSFTKISEIIKSQYMDILEILKYTLPALIVFFTAYLLIRSFIKGDRDRRNQEIILQNQKTITPIRLQAYERVALFLERISPESLIIRINKPGMTSQHLQQAMLTTIRAEFEHNLSQQVYITTQAWEVVKNAKANTTKIINSSADKVKPNDPAIKLSKLILERVMEMDKVPTQVAIDFLKNEINRIF
jgi:hypothetical protein